MKIGILTSHNPRHYFVANTIASIADEALIVTSAMGLNPAVAGHHGEKKDSLIKYFEERFRTEMSIFSDRFFDVKKGGVIAVGPNEINSSYVYNQLKAFQPDLIVVFGTNILKGLILEVCPRILNIHLGLSPYFNGTSSNFWPMYNGILEYIGVTVHYLDAGIDTGDILGQTRADIVNGDNPHTIGNKNIIAGVGLLKEIIPYLENQQIKGIKQWESSRWPIYKMKDFTAEIEQSFIRDINNGSINQWVHKKEREVFQMVKFTSSGPRLVSSSDFPAIHVNIYNKEL